MIRYQRAIQRKIVQNSRRFITNTHVEKLNSLHTLSSDELLLKESVSKFAAQIIAPLVSVMDEKEALDPKVLKGLFDQGLMGIEIEAKYGGSESSFMSSILAVEELAKVDPAVSVVCDVQNTLVNTVFRKYGSKELQQKYLTQLATDKVGCFCLSEASSGSDAFALATTAKESKDGYIINGSKLWITNSNEASIYLVFANMDLTKGYRGITCFVLDKEHKGIEIGPKEKKLGIRASSTCPVIFNNVQVSKSNIVGEIGKGYKYAIELLNEGRIGIAAQMIGLAQGVFDKTIPYLFERKQFNQAIGEFQAMQHQYAYHFMQIEAARLMTYNAARLRDEKKNFVSQAAMAKLFSSKVAHDTSSWCIEAMGGIGFTRDAPIEKFFRDSKIGAIYEGTSNIQLNTIAKYVKEIYSK